MRMCKIRKVFCNAQACVSCREYACILAKCAEFSLQIQGGTADKVFYSSLTDYIFLSRAFFVFTLIEKLRRKQLCFYLTDDGVAHYDSA